MSEETISNSHRVAAGGEIYVPGELPRTPVVSPNADADYEQDVVETPSSSFGNKRSQYEAAANAVPSEVPMVGVKVDVDVSFSLPSFLRRDGAK